MSAAKKLQPEDVLIENTTAGIRGVAYSVPTDSVNAAVREHKIHQINLLPGLNLVPSKVWEQQEAHAARRIEAGEIVVRKTMEHMGKAEAMRAIANTGDPRVLKRLLAEEKRQDVADAIEKQMTKIRRGGHTLRQAQAAHARH